jgi:hypothetical protein
MSETPQKKRKVGRPRKENKKENKNETDDSYIQETPKKKTKINYEIEKTENYEEKEIFEVTKRKIKSLENDNVNQDINENEIESFVPKKGKKKII